MNPLPYRAESLRTGAQSQNFHFSSRIRLWNLKRAGPPEDASVTSTDAAFEMRTARIGRPLLT